MNIDVHINVETWKFTIWVEFYIVPFPNWYKEFKVLKHYQNGIIDLNEEK